MSDSTLRTALYLRISLDQTGEGLAIARQRELCNAIAEQRNWTVVAEYVDNSITASDSRKNRPGYDALVGAYEAGKFDALVCYDLDRLTRQPRQLEDWIDAADGRGLALVTANGEADLTTDAGRMFARIKVAVAKGEVERKSARQRAAAHQRAQIGRPPLGVRLTGYTPRGETVPDEAALVRRVFGMFLAGETLRSIAATLTLEGVRTRRGAPWNPSSIRELLKNPRYAGRVIYRGEVMPDAEAAWEALVDGGDFDLVQAKLADPRRLTHAGTSRKHLGSGLYLCGVCRQPVHGWSGGRYRCKSACVNRSGGQVDQFVRDVVAQWIDDERYLGLDDGAEERADLLAELAQLRTRLERVELDYDAGLIDGARFKAASDRVRAEMTVVDRSLAGTRSDSALRMVLESPDPPAAFLGAPLLMQRSLVGAVTREIRLAPGVRGSRVFRPESVVVEWR